MKERKKSSCQFVFHHFLDFDLGPHKHISTCNECPDCTPWNQHGSMLVQTEHVDPLWPGQWGQWVPSEKLLSSLNVNEIFHHQFNRVREGAEKKDGST